MKRLTFVAVLLFVFAVYLVACGPGQEVEEPPTAATEEVATEPPMVEESGQESECPKKVDVSEHLSVELEPTSDLCVSAKAIPGEDGECTIFRWLGAFQVLTDAGEPPEGPSTVQWTATYTAEDVEQAQELGPRLCLGILFASGSETHFEPDPDPEGGTIQMQLEGDLSDPVVGVGSG